MTGSEGIGGLRDVRTGLLFMIVGSIVVFTGALLGLGSASPVSPQAATRAMALAVGAFLIGATISLAGLFAYMRGGLRALSRVDGRFRLPYMGTTLMAIGIIVNFAALVLIVAFLLAGPGDFPAALSRLARLAAIMLVGSLIELVGFVLAFVVLAFHLYGKYNDMLFVIAGILYIIDTAFPSVRMGGDGATISLAGIGGFLSFVGHLLMYMALGKVVTGAKGEGG